MNQNNSFLSSLWPHKIRFWPALAISATFAMILFVTLGNIGSSAANSPILREFEVGKVAERDFIADKSISYVDDEATQLRKKAQEHLVPAVFRYSTDATRDALAMFGRFKSMVRSLFTNRVSADAFRLGIQAEYPGMFPQQVLETLYRSPSRERFLEYAESVLKILLEEGIFATGKLNLDLYNPDQVEVIRKGAIRTERERIPINRMVTLITAKERIAEIASSGSYPSSFTSIAPYILTPFVVENVFFSQEDTNLRLEETRARLEPVIRQIERGERIIKKGSIVSKDDLARIKALNQGKDRQNPIYIMGLVGMLLFSFGLLLFMTSPAMVGRKLEAKEIYFLTILGGLYGISAIVLSRMIGIEYLSLAVFVPTALFVMLPAVITGGRTATAIAISMPVIAFALGAYDEQAFLFALAAGITGVFSMRAAERRIDLIKAGLFVAAMQALFSLVLLLFDQSPLSVFPMVIFWSAFNGLICGMLVLAFLPLLEQWLNATTTFRLMELADLNSPVLKRLLTVAPGTYSHSVTVANLAESACRDIGANALLARVGAYYHDIGKMDQPDYFIENQAAYNKHDELAPRLSATIIRSHVKLGIEKARALGLPQAVIDIISEHHGNSVIAWFYNEALKREDQVKADDFSYPGNPPRSKESAVVMLADTVEAAMRTLKKPTITKIEKFVHELIIGKFEQGQLDQSELTFKDLELIKSAFVRVLAGHYHSRIEYPKISREVPFEQG
ncbi:HD family phosphohydrolase [Gracilinema caldarium]|uniref:HD family phosphohydrolase n=1 Tax=Gracilinema caldarium TaxID=215591 RepID=UPI0026EC785D|nr:HDIG domain-containing metalloprotein [Gracilinema caldarium]